MAEIPRYKLSVGKQLTYRTSAEIAPPAAADGAAPPLRSVDEWVFYVVDRIGADRWRIVLSHSRTTEIVSASECPASRTVSYDAFFDIDSQGRLDDNWTITPLADPTIVFPRLPMNRSQAESSWCESMRLDDAHCTYSPADASATGGQPTWPFCADCRTKLDPIYGMRRRRRYEFDPAQGCITRVAASLQRDWPASSRPAASQQRIDLIDVVQHSQSEIAQARLEADRYFDRAAEYQRLIDLALWDLSRSSRWLEDAADVLEELAPTLRVGFVGELLRRKRELHERESPGMLSDTKKFASMIGQPAPEWHAADLEGRLHVRGDYEGRALALCFWNRGCDWSIRALLDANTLAADLPQRPIALLGVNGDANFDDASFVWQALGIKFPAVVDSLGEPGCARPFRVEGFPTTVVIDPAGIVRRARVGYSPSLSPMLARELKDLSKTNGPQLV